MSSERKKTGGWPENDHELLRALQSSDIRTRDNAIKHIMQTYQRNVYSYLWKEGCRDENVQEDIFYATLEILIQRRQVLYIKAQFSTIVIGFVRNIWRTRLKQIIKDKLTSSIEVLEQVGSDDDRSDLSQKDIALLDQLVFDDQHFYDLGQDQSEVTLAVREALKEMKGRHCIDIFEMKIYYNWTHQEIAEELSLTREHVTELRNGKCMQELEMILRKKGLGIPKMNRNIQAPSSNSGLNTSTKK